MTNLIGTVLSGTIAGEDATFKIVKEKTLWNGEVVYIVECVEFGAPRIKISKGWWHI
tara:strand:+ start:18147 stop:18317 length:171 start_codon:yes stop_codon:yes gene_type:complete